MMIGLLTLGFIPVILGLLSWAYRNDRIPLAVQQAAVLYVVVSVVAGVVQIYVAISAA